MSNIISIFLLLASIGVFFGYVDRNYRSPSVENNIVTLQAEREQYAVAIENSTKLIEKRNELVVKKNNLSEADELRLKKLLPDHVDNVRLIIDLDRIAQKHGITIRNITIDDAASKKDSAAALGAAESPVGTIGLKFSIQATYDRFLSFVGDLERSLRLVDITDVTFSSSDTGIYDIGIAIKTYWLK
jgi:hypothetical protein